MKRLLILTMVSLLGSCSPKNVVPVAPNENIEALHSKFHGKYNVIRSVSSEAIDVNLDGQVSTDMLREIEQLAPEYGHGLELRIYGPDKYRSEKALVFTQAWPEQYISLRNTNKIWEGEDIAYEPGLVVSYVQQGSVHAFSFSPDLRQIIVKPGTNDNSFRWVKPENVTIDQNTGALQVVNKRRLYTSQGVKDVVITTVYERYTIIT